MIINSLFEDTNLAAIHGNVNYMNGSILFLTIFKYL